MNSGEINFNTVLQIKYGSKKKKKKKVFTFHVKNNRQIITLCEFLNTK